MHKHLSLLSVVLAALAPAVARADGDAAPHSTPAPESTKSPDAVGEYIPPRFVPYQGGDIPSSARIETKPNVAFVATGVSLLASAYLSSIVYGLSTCGAQTDCRQGSGWLYLPIAGPFVTSAMAPTTGGQALAAFDGGLQVTGAVLTIVGFVLPRKYVMWQSKAKALSFSPSLPVSPIAGHGLAEPRTGATHGFSLKLSL